MTGQYRLTGQVIWSERVIPNTPATFAHVWAPIFFFFFFKIWYLAENKRENIAFPKYQLLGELINHTFFIDYRLIVIFRYFCFKNNPTKAGLQKLVYRLIVLFLSTEIFSKRRKIYAWFEEKPEWCEPPWSRHLYSEHSI